MQNGSSSDVEALSATSLNHLRLACEAHGRLNCHSGRSTKSWGRLNVNDQGASTTCVVLRRPAPLHSAQLPGPQRHVDPSLGAAAGDGAKSLQCLPHRRFLPALCRLVQNEFNASELGREARNDLNLEMPRGLKSLRPR